MDHLNQPTQNVATLDDKSASAVKARIALFCDTTGVEPVKLATRKGEMQLTDDLLDWCRANGASLDWITSGDVASMIRQCRHSRLHHTRLMPQADDDAVTVLPGDLDQHHKARTAFDERGDVAVSGPTLQIAFPVAGNGAIIDLS